MLGSFSFDIAGVLSIYVDLNRFNCAVPCECQILGYSIFLDRKGFDVVVGPSSHLGISFSHKTTQIDAVLSVKIASCLVKVFPFT